MIQCDSPRLTLATHASYSLHWHRYPSPIAIPENHHSSANENPLEHQDLPNPFNMELAFASKYLRCLCEHIDFAGQSLPPAVAKALRHRLADIRAATNIHDLLAGKPRLVDRDDTQHLVIDLTNSHNMTLIPNHTRNPLTSQGTINWQRVIRLQLVHIGTPCE